MEPNEGKEVTSTIRNHDDMKADYEHDAGNHLMDAHVKSTIRNHDDMKADYEEEHLMDAHVTVVPADLNRDRFIFGVSEYPPWYMTILGAIQQITYNIGGPISMVYAIRLNLCSPDNQTLYAQLLSTAIFLTGLCTFLQVTFGIRLPMVQGSSGAFVPVAVAMMATPQWKCPDKPSNCSRLAENCTALWAEYDNAWQPRLNELSGSLAIASCTQVILGCTGGIGFLKKYIGPLTIIPTLSMIAFALYPYAAKTASKQWGIAVLTLGLVLLFALFLERFHVPFPAYNKKRGMYWVRYPIFRLFYFILAMSVAWLVSYILTVTDVFPNDPDTPSYMARTDARTEVLHEMPWWFWPYPGRFGMPTVSAGVFIGMFGATIASIMESIGDYYATADICQVPPPPKHAMNRAVAMEGFGSVIAGLLGVAHATTSYSNMTGFIAVTGVRSRIVWQTFGIMMMFFGCIGKLSAFLSIVPDPIIGSLLCTGLGMVAVVGISNVKHLDVTSPRNILCLGITHMLAMMIPSWMHANPEAISTGNSDADQVVFVLLGSPMFVGGLLGFILDNLVPGTAEERGLTAFMDVPSRPGDETTCADDAIKVYDLPWFNDVMRRTKWCSYVPFLPSYQERDCSCFKRRGKGKHVPDSDSTPDSEFLHEEQS